MHQNRGLSAVILLTVVKVTRKQKFDYHFKEINCSVFGLPFSFNYFVGSSTLLL